jgi:hypothetical protein
LVVDAVLRNQSPLAEFPAIREKNKDFRVSGANFAQIMPPKCNDIRNLWWQFPTQTNRELNRCSREKSCGERGIKEPVSLLGSEEREVAVTELLGLLTACDVARI